jgi:hypothetical protein
MKEPRAPLGAAKGARALGGAGVSRSRRSRNPFLGRRSQPDALAEHGAMSLADMPAAVLTQMWGLAVPRRAESQARRP